MSLRAASTMRSRVRWKSERRARRGAGWAVVGMPVVVCAIQNQKSTALSYLSHSADGRSASLTIKLFH
jgi:hypothetical protein